MTMKDAKVRGGTRSLELEISDAGAYLWFQPEVPSAQTIVAREWPHIGVDLDDQGFLVGIELVPVPTEISVEDVLRWAGIPIPTGEKMQIGLVRSAAPAGGKVAEPDC